MSQKVSSFTQSGWRKLICGKSADRRAKAIESDRKDPISCGSDPASPLKAQLNWAVGSERSPQDQTAIASYKSDKAPSHSAYELELKNLTNDEDEHDAFDTERDSQDTGGNGLEGKYILGFSSGRPVITEVIGTESGYRLLLSKGHKHERKTSQK